MLARLGEFAHGGVTRAQYRAVGQRMVYRVAHETAAHAGGAMIEQRQQRGRRLAAQGFGQLQITPRGRIHAHPLAGLLHGERAQVGHSRTLRRFHVIEQCIRRAEGNRQLLRAKAA